MISPKMKFVRFAKRSQSYGYKVWNVAADRGCLFRLHVLPRTHFGYKHIAIPMCPCITELQREDEKLSSGYWSGAAQAFNRPDFWGGIYLDWPEQNYPRFEQVEVWHSPTSPPKKSKKPKGKS